MRRRHLPAAGAGLRHLFLTSKVRLHCDPGADGHDGPLDVYLFLTSKVRLHCDPMDVVRDEQGQILFLTSKVRLHCDFVGAELPEGGMHLFLTSKVRLHCDGSQRYEIAWPWDFS